MCIAGKGLCLESKFSQKIGDKFKKNKGAQQ
jgi:hypothetical protein